MKLKELFPKEELIRLEGEEDAEITATTLEPTARGAGYGLIVLKAETAIRKDLSDGFSAIICEEALARELKGKGRALAVVKSVRAAWSHAESRLAGIDYSRTRFVAVTGTNGKTTTARIISHILEENGHRVGFIGTGRISVGEKILSDVNHSMTTPDPPILYSAIRRMQELGCDLIVMEVSSHALHFAKTAPIPFELAIFTNLSPEHLDFHRDMREYMRDKLGLLSYSRQAIFNVDDLWFRRAADKCSIPYSTAGILWRGDAYLTNIETNEAGETSFIYRGDGFGFLAKTRLPGKFNLYNAMLALTAAIKLGVAPCKAKTALEGFSGVEGRCEMVYNGDFKVIIDYAHTEAALSALFGYLRETAGSRRLIAVFGCGGERYREKRPMMAKYAERFADKSYITADNSRSEPTEDIISDITVGFSNRESYTVISNRADAITAAILDAKEGDTVVLIGKGAERYNIDADGYHAFDERLIVSEAIKKRGNVQNESHS